MPSPLSEGVLSHTSVALPGCVTQPAARGLRPGWSPVGPWARPGRAWDVQLIFILCDLRPFDMQSQTYYVTQLCGTSTYTSTSSGNRVTRNPVRVPSSCPMPGPSRVSRATAAQPEPRDGHESSGQSESLRTHWHAQHCQPFWQAAKTVDDAAGAAHAGCQNG